MGQATTAIFGIIAVVSFVFIGSEVASRGLVEHDSGVHLNVNAPDIWPMQPVRVDVATQDYERIAPLGSEIAIRGGRPSNRLVPNNLLQANLGFNSARFNG